MICHYCKTSSQDSNFIFENNSWIVVLASDQSYLGRCTFLLKKHKGDLSELTNEEIIDFLECLKKLENSIRKAFGAEMFNITCLMNDAYKSAKPDPHIHWHLRPRYRNSVKFESILFTDPDFAQHYDNKRKTKIPEEVEVRIIKTIKKNL